MTEPTLAPDRLTGLVVSTRCNDGPDLFAALTVLAGDSAVPGTD